MMVSLLVGALGGYVTFQQQTAGLLSQVNALQSQISGKDTQIANLQSQIDAKNIQVTSLQSQVSSLQSQFTEFNQSYQTLLSDYNELLDDYNLLNAPARNLTSVGDLDFTITTYQHIYNYQDPVSGNVTIYYHNGTAFKGAFSIYLLHVDNMATTAKFEVDGYGEFFVASPLSFIKGPGNYTIGISSLYTADGYIIESRWQVFPSVQVEAK
jgi:chaperonin cofactor prefoldin